jgi:hypothetical protein
MRGASADRAKCVVFTDANRRRMRCRGSVAELAVVILAPAPRDAAARDPTTVR